MNDKERYQNLRKIQKEVNSRLWETIPAGPPGHKLMLDAARELGYKVRNGTVPFLNVTVEDRIAELLLHEPNSAGACRAVSFLESNPPLSVEERRMLEAISGKVASLYEVQEVNRDSRRVLIHDLLEERPPCWLTDLGFSAFAESGHLLYLRLISVDGIHFASGASMAYPSENKAFVLKRLSEFHRLKNPYLRSRKRFIAAVKLEKTHGVTMLYL